MDETGVSDFDFDKGQNDNMTIFGGKKLGACFFACFFGEKIWKTSENFVPLHCQRKMMKFAA